MEKNEQENNELQELHDIIMGLRIANYSEIDDEAISDQVEFMIRELPSSEELDSMDGKSADLQYLRDKLGYIMSVIKGGGCKDEAFKARYEAKKDMPPRYKVLKWRGAMTNKTLTSGLIKMSSFADAHSNPLIAEKAIALAKKSSDGDISEDDLRVFVADCKNAGFERESQNLMQNIKDKFTGGPGKQVIQDRKKVDKEKLKNDQTILNSLHYISQLVNSESYETDKIKQMISGMPNSSAKQMLSRYIQSIEGLENNFYTQINELADSANGMINSYKTTGNFGDGTAAPVAAEPTATAIDQTGEEDVAGDDTASAPVVSEPATPTPAAATSYPPPPSGINLNALGDADKTNLINILRSSKRKYDRVVNAQVASPSSSATTTMPSSSPSGSFSPAFQNWIQEIKSNPQFRSQVLEQLGAGKYFVGQRVKSNSSGKGGTISEIKTNGFLMVQIDGQPKSIATRPESVTVAKTKKSIKLSFNRKWIRVA